MMVIYYWNNQGRLGNLLFQYVAIKSNTLKDDKVICFESDVFAVVKDDKKFIRIKFPKKINLFFNSKLNKLFDYFVSLNLVSSISPEIFYVKNKFPCESKNLIKKIGFFKSICQIKGFFQHDKWILDQLELKSDIVIKAGERLSGISKSKCKVALHIRSTDYKEWIVFGKKDATISSDWYMNAIEYVNSFLENPEFILFTDDRDILKKMNICNPVVLFDGDSPVEDLAAISLCEHAILSPSTFSYCGAMLSYKKGKLIIAPKYWAGFKSKTWFPQTIETKNIKYLEVNYD